MRRDTKPGPAAPAALALLLAALLMACGGGGGDDGSTAPRTYVGTQSPGDLWSWSLDPAGTFEAENETLGYVYGGTWTTLPSEFLKLVVTSTTEPGLSTPATAYAFEAPASALVIKPAGPGDNVIVAVSTGTCPSGPSLPLAWTELTDAAWDPLTSPAYGTADVAMAGATWDVLTSAWYLDGSAAGGETLLGLTCAGGIVTDPADPDAVLAMASTGVFVRDGGPGGGAAMGMRRPATDVSLADLTAAGREFRGFHYEDESLASPDSIPVWARPDGTGGLHGGEYDDVETDAESAMTPATIAFTGQSAPGVVQGTLTDSSGTSDIVFLINRLGGRYFLFGISVDTHDGHPYNFVAIETGP